VIDLVVLGVPSDSQGSRESVVARPDNQSREDDPKERRDEEDEDEGLQVGASGVLVASEELTRKVQDRLGKAHKSRGVAQHQSAWCSLSFTLSQPRDGDGASN